MTGRLGLLAPRWDEINIVGLDEVSACAAHRGVYNWAISSSLDRLRFPLLLAADATSWSCGYLRGWCEIFSALKLGWLCNWRTLAEDEACGGTCCKTAAYWTGSIWFNC